VQLLSNEHIDFDGRTNEDEYLHNEFIFENCILVLRYFIKIVVTSRIKSLVLVSNNIQILFGRFYHYYMHGQLGYNGLPGSLLIVIMCI